MRVHRELLARPVHRAAEAAELAGDLAAAFRLPLPHLVDEIFAAVVGALVLPGLELAPDDHLRCDTGMVLSYALNQRKLIEGVLAYQTPTGRDWRRDRGVQRGA